ncbi:MAG: hypothetical protein V5A56_09250 [Halolamina sp.]
MPQLTIYTSEGTKYDGQSTTQNDRIQRFFLERVRFALETGQQLTIYCFFRARESESGRSEQFYAKYETKSRSRLFDSFKQALERRVEQELGMTLVTGLDDVRVYDTLTDTTDEAPGDRYDHDAIDALLRNGHRLSFGVGSHESALATLNAFVQNGNAGFGAIVDDAANVSLDTFDLLVEPGTYRGLQPLGDTAEKLETWRAQVEEEYIQKTLTNIEKDLRTLQQRTSISSAELGKRLRRQLPMLSTATASGATGDEQADTYKQGAAIFGIVVGVLVLGVIATYVASSFGLSVPFASVLSWNDGGGETAGAVPTPTIEAPQNNSTLESSSITVRGNASVDTVLVTLESRGQTIHEKNVTVTENSFSVELAANSSGTYTVQVTPANNTSAAATATFTIQLPPEETATDEPTATPTQTNTSTSNTSASVVQPHAQPRRPTTAVIHQRNRGAPRRAKP